MIDLPWLRKRGNFFKINVNQSIIIIIDKRKSGFVTDSNWLVELYRLAAIQLLFFSNNKNNNNKKKKHKTKQRQQIMIFHQANDQFKGKSLENGII